MNNKLAICVLTYDHPQVVRTIASYCADYLRDTGVDLYYYDSSSDEETKRTIHDLNVRGYDNVYHIEVSSDLDYGQKVDLVFSGYGLKKDYDYIWPIKDRIIHNEYAIKLVLERLCNDPEPDIVAVLASGDLFGGFYIDIDSPVELYKLFGKQTTSIGTVIYNTRTILKDYTYGKSATAPKYLRDYWHYDFLYRKMEQMPYPLISIISKKGAVTAESNAAGESGWRKDVWKIWIEEWVQLNYELPDMYSPYKLQVIKDTTSIPELFGDRETLKKLYEDGLLTAEVYKKYKDMWSFVSTVPVEEIERIASGILE